MVLLLNYLPWIIIAIGAVAVYKSVTLAGPASIKAVFFSVIGTLIALVILQGVTAGYLPKNPSSHVKIPSPEFEPTDAEIQNRLRSPPRLGAESEERFNAKTEWRKPPSDTSEKPSSTD